MSNARAARPVAMQSNLSPTLTRRHIRASRPVRSSSAAIPQVSQQGANGRENASTIVLGMISVPARLFLLLPMTLLQHVYAMWRLHFRADSLPAAAPGQIVMKSNTSHLNF